MTTTIPSQRILVVDDEPIVRQSIEMLLNAEGHKVETVNGGEQALKKLDKSNYDFVFTDHIMDGMSGEELARAIKTKYPLQMVVMITAYCQVLDQVTQDSPMVDLTLTKPIDIPFLRLALHHLISRKNLGQGKEKAAHF